LFLSPNLFIFLLALTSLSCTVLHWGQVHSLSLRAMPYILDMEFYCSLFGNILYLYAFNIYFLYVLYKNFIKLNLFVTILKNFRIFAKTNANSSHPHFVTNGFSWRKLYKNPLRLRRGLSLQRV